MKDLLSKEHLIYFMQLGYLRLSKFDLNFVTNLNLNIIQNKPITTNQVELLNKLVEKYKKQLLKHGFNNDLLNSLPWTSKLINSDPNFTNVFISLDNNQIIFRSPFNKKFLQEFRTLNYNPYVWSRDKKYYSCDFSSVSLKILYDIVPRYFTEINYCTELEKIINDVETLRDCIWQPTLVRVNNNHYIFATNERLNNELEQISLDDSMNTLSELAEYHIKVDNSVLNNNKKLVFASNFNPEISTDEIADLIDYLIELKCDCIYYTSSFKVNVKEPLLKELKKVTENHVNLNNIFVKGNQNTKYPILLQFGSAVTDRKIQTYNIKKVIKIKNFMKIQ